MRFGAYEIFVTSQTLPHLEITWVEVNVAGTSYWFSREGKRTKAFSISGYISKGTMADTRAEAEGLNTALNTTPSGVFVDGNDVSYSCIVDDWEISPVAGVNKYTFTISGKVA
jgi:hypothetical protein